MRIRNVEMWKYGNEGMRSLIKIGIKY